MRLSIRYRRLYALYGAAFGIAFPLIAGYIRYTQNGAEALGEDILRDPLLWIIATAPLFLGLFAWFGGVQRDKAQDVLNALRITNEQLTHANQEIQHQIDVVEEQSRNIEISNGRLQEMNTELLTANEFKVKMLGIASHDLKNPLANILISAELLIRKPDDATYTVQRAEDIHRSGSEMQILINELLDTTAIHLGKMPLRLGYCDLVQLVLVRIEAHKTLANEKQQRIIAHVPDALIIQADGMRLQQVIDNLLSNAIKYSGLGGTITVSIIEQSLIKQGYVELYFYDTGQGFTEADKSQMFGMFQRLSAQPTAGESSSGVGLATVKNIIELHGGTITLETAPGQGSTFIVRLPQFQHSVGR